MQKMSRQFYQRLQTLEAKGIVRRVRTPEGVAKYNQPIGSIIRPTLDDAVPVRKNKRGVKVGEWAKGDFTSLKASTHKGRIASVEDLDFYEGDQPFLSHAKVGPVIVTRNESYGEREVYTVKLGGRVQTDDLYVRSLTTPPSSFEQIQESKFLYKLNKHRDKPEVRRAQRAEDSLFAYWEGIYGWDWQNEDDDISEDDFDDPIKRKEIAIKESKELGISVNGARFLGEDYLPDVGVHETINALMRSYQDAYPGFTNLINTFNLSFEKENPYAWNGNMPVPDPNNPGTLKEGTYIGLNAKYWAEDEDDGSPTKRLADGKLAGSKSGWTSMMDLEKFAEDNEMEMWQVAAIQVLNHEVGHTIARMIFGEIKGAEHSEDSTNYYSLDTRAWKGIDSEAWRDEYAANMAPILEKYGVIKSEDAMWDVDTTNIFETMGIRNGNYKKYHLPYKWDKETVTANLSEYGSTNLHEVMAEVWAAFTMEEKPTEFVQEMGQAMEDMMMMWLEEAGLS